MGRRRRRVRRAGRRPRSRWTIINHEKGKGLNFQERLRQQAIKDAEKERAQFYAKQKEGQKDVRAKYREKVRAVWFGLGKNREGPNHNV